MAKRIAFHDQAHRSMKKGVDIVAEAVKFTLGPGGRNIAVDQRFGCPIVTHDGVTVAKEIDIDDPLENMAAFLIREVASKTNDSAGDGTTTAMVLAQIIVREGMKNLAAGANPMQIKQGLEKGTEAILEYIRTHAIPLKSKKEIAQLATISAADKRIGQLIADVMDRVTMDGIITVEASHGTDFEVKYSDGMQLDRGYLSPHFVTDQAKMEAVLENPYILLTDKKISTVQDILPILETLTQQGHHDLVIIAEDVVGEALATLVLNKTRGILNVLAVRAPSFGDRRREVMRDIAILTGGQLISEETGLRLDKVSLSDLGSARLVVAHKDDVTILDGKGSKTAIQTRIRELRAQLQDVGGDYDHEKLQQRLAKLAGGVAIIKVGATTELELKYRKTRVEDAVAATRSAIEEGMLPGGGVALLNAIEALDAVKFTGDAATGVNILRRALEQPLRQLAINAGYNGAVAIDGVRRAQQKHKNTRYGYNVLTNKYEDMIKSGIIDPAKVTRCALENATSIAAMILTTDVMVAEVPEWIDPRPLMGEF